MLTSIEIRNFKAIKDGQDENGNITEKPLILKLSRTIADLDNQDKIAVKHLAESLQYRGRWAS
jgi:predicted ATPase with chaperone activity